MLKRLDVRGVPQADLRQHLPRPSLGEAPPIDVVRAIIADVAARGDAALLEYTQRFDGVALAELTVPRDELAAAVDALDPALRTALEEARDAIASYHRGQLQPEHVQDRGGVSVRARSVAVDRAGLYVPGGRAIYPSTVLMTAIPARVAGVENLALCVPPDRSTGRVPTVTLAAAALAGVTEVHPVGGAQAIAAMAYGTESIEPVDVIVGPGNAYVALAKREVAGSGRVSIPSAFAGPSEVVVIADETVPATYAAIDLVVQAEHGPGGLAWLLCWSEAVADLVIGELERLVEAAPRRADILATLDGNGFAVLCDGPDQALAVAKIGRAHV